MPLLVPANGIFDKEGLGRWLNSYYQMQSPRIINFHYAARAVKAQLEPAPLFIHQIEIIRQIPPRFLFEAATQLMPEAVFRGHDTAAMQVKAGLGSRLDLFNAMAEVK